MVAHLTMRTHGGNQAFRFVEGIWLHRKSHQIGYFYPKRPIFPHACATCNELPSNLSTMGDPESESGEAQISAINVP